MIFLTLTQNSNLKWITLEDQVRRKPLFQDILYPVPSVGTKLFLKNLNVFGLTHKQHYEVEKLFWSKSKIMWLNVIL